MVNQYRSRKTLASPMAHLYTPIPGRCGVVGKTQASKAHQSLALAGLFSLGTALNEFRGRRSRSKVHHLESTRPQPFESPGFQAGGFQLPSFLSRSQAGEGARTAGAAGLAR